MDPQPDRSAPARPVRLVAWYRPEVARRLRRVLLPAALLMLLGSLTWAHVAVFHGGRDVVAQEAYPAPGQPTRLVSAPPGAAVGLMLGGLALCVSGGLLAVLGLLWTMREESYLALRTDGALWHRDGEEIFIDWDHIERVRWDADARALVFDRRDRAEPFRLERRFADVEGPDLAKRLEDVRRKAIWGLI